MGKESSRLAFEVGAQQSFGGRCLAWLVYLFLVAPTIVVIGASFGKSPIVNFPPSGLSLHWYRFIFTSATWRTAAIVSGELIISVVPLCLVLALPAAYGLARARFLGRGLLNVLFLGPLMVPQILLGLSLLYFLAHTGLLGSFQGVLIGQTIVAFPYVMRVISANMSALDPVLEDAGQSLGASRLRVFRDITLPLIRPAVIAGAILGAVISFGELAVTVFTAGPNTTTLPLVIFSHVQYQDDPSVAAVSTVFVVVAIIILVAVDRAIGLTKLS